MRQVPRTSPRHGTVQQHHVLFIVAALLVVAGIVMTTWREPAAGDEVDGEAVEASDAPQPYFWPGVAAFVAGIVVGGWTFRKYRRG